MTGNSVSGKRISASGGEGAVIKIHGFNKLTLLDYPGRLACTIFLGNCNLRCPFCHNAGLVLNPNQEPVVPQEEVFGVLKKRQGILDGVCITGGEPTLHPQLPEFIKKIREYGYPVKLDTNGSNPEMLKSLVKEGLVDYVAMDIKNSPAKYAVTAGVSRMDLDVICESVDFLKTEAVDYEFRTTVTRELHKKEDFCDIGNWLDGSRRYFLQTYKESGQVIRPVFSSYSREQLENFRQMLAEHIGQVEIRGV